MPDNNDPAFAEGVFHTVHAMEQMFQHLTGDPNVELNALLMMVTTYGLHQIHEIGMDRQEYIDMVVKQINHLMDTARVHRGASTFN